MDDSCAVCAETLEWVAYGACGHRDVCSTCVARLRFICNDSCCCICKTENAVVFVTKALGYYTRSINDFSLFPSEPREGRLGSYWYHEDTQAFFDDVDHYRMIKAMCKLSCSVCDNTEDKLNGAPKRRQRFRNIEQLKGHIFHQHKLVMCSLCLEGRKVFICEQKLYTRSQLNQHISTGDSEVDGTESERGGFAGHPVCEFCRTPFYGDNELYIHMSTEHYTCFICQRERPGQHEYFKNYDDLEIHFRHEHFLCEDEGCLAKKFIAFQSEAEMKRHNVLEHGGRMSRAKRSAALQIPTSFRYRSSDQDRRRGRRLTFRRDFAEEQISAAIEASLEYANVDSTNPHGSSSSTLIMPDSASGTDDIDQIVQPFESLNTTEPDQPSRYLRALGQSYGNTRLQEAAFPPLAGSSSSSNQASRRDTEISQNTMAEHIRHQNNKRNLNVARKWNAAVRPTASSTAAPFPSNVAAVPSPLDMGSGSVSSSYASLAKGQALGGAAAALRVKSSSPSRRSDGSGAGRIIHSSSAPNLAEKELVESSTYDFPPISAAIPKRNQTLPQVEDVQAANKSLVEKMRAALDNDQEKYASFKDISARYRQGSIDTQMYLNYVQHFGLSHLILDLARLCPDPGKQKELLETYNASVRENGLKDVNWGQDSNKGSKKGKGKQVHGPSSSGNTLAESFLGTVRDLQSKNRVVDQEVEVLTKEGYRRKGKSKAASDDEWQDSASLMLKLENQMDDQSANGGMNQNVGDRGGGRKQQKKTSKFHRVRLGEGSAAAILDLRNSDRDPGTETVDNRSENNGNSSGGLPLRGVWQRGGGHKLF
ncbi:hypothetical protein SAY86_024291 [Trapa natans]|uniref:RING-type E3 ubiquitin transferase n=1 Tax=Trapa natans TaxID=22666 RepID=A0AAN7M4J9_TRANT|nr:hypothetical protein SAY86_024291 [Trapa natans]